MNIIEMKMYDEYWEKQRQENNYFRPKEPTHEDKKKWLKDNVNLNTLIEYALDHPTIITTLYEHFKQ